MGLYDITVQDIIQKNVVVRGNAVGFVWNHDKRTFGQYAHEVMNLASGLASQGIGKGDRIGVFAYNCYEYFLLYGAAAFLGCLLVPLNWRLKSEEVQVILEICMPKALVAGQEFVDVAEGVLNQCDFVEHRLAIGEKQHGFLTLQEIAHPANKADTFIDASREDPLVILPTAAVEGKPKGAVISHMNVVAASMQNMVVMGRENMGVYLNLMPLFHVMGLEVAFTAMHAGGVNVIMEKFDAQEAVKWIDKEQVTIVASVPPMLSRILDQAEEIGTSLKSLRIVAGLAEHPDTVQRCQTMTKAKFWVGYGQSETMGYISLSPYDARPGSSGRQGPLARIRLVDEYDRDVERENPGEVLVRGPLVFKRYWNLDDETGYTVRGGWHHTGDLCRLDEKGYLWYVKRKAEKELIKPGGENVYPAEVERALLEHPDVLGACVFGVPDKQWGEAVKAVCVCRAGSTLSAQELINFVGSRIARYKKPNYITFVESLPKNEDGSVDREKVKEEHKSPEGTD
jgi:acyl-CoA synthetase (AMP-forming)/AMP-acid ligase II